MSSTNLSPTSQLSVGKKHMWCFQRGKTMVLIFSAVYLFLLLLGLLVIEPLNWRKSFTSHRQETAEKQSRKYKNKSVKKRFGGGLTHKIPHVLCQTQKSSSSLWIHIELPILIIHFDNYDTLLIDFSTLICQKLVSVYVSKLWLNDG